MSKLVFIDTETGGVLWKHPLIQIGAVVVENNTIIEEYEAKLTFNENDCDPDALKINCYSKLRKTWNAQAQSPIDAMKAFDKWLRPHCDVEKISKRNKPYKAARGVAYNAKFDVDVLSRTWRAADQFLAIGYPWLDVMQLAIWQLWKKPIENFKLKTVAEFLGIKDDELEFHDALYDAKIAFRVAMELTGGDVSGVMFGDEPERQAE